ncbi:SafA/ExsA family spore coat assembly protein [Bacillus sp. KH172YL63]|uniref:SafA/ExsA family spore coat assembly protein n=1 Tax=Bacillus sp. KH172YL63 TaxID=2709784 RepID=UPI0013E491DA|nr:SafA/ExsA family spore coat assembly protein [Bacillus sp. KH172YL63]BCB02063.1 hypothetical protein KH172YL63_01960 [Bacillus sp. KH172YL63]
MKTKRSILIVLSSLVFGLSALPVASAQGPYSVKKGDTLWNISNRFQLSLSALINANPQLSDPDLIYPGQRIIIPSAVRGASVENRVTELANAEREKNGLPPLRLDPALSRVALTKSCDMRDRGYFSHKSPAYGTPGDMLKASRIPFSDATENIAAGQSTPEEAIGEWMESPVNRKQILTGSYTHLGVGYCRGGAYESYWTVLLIRR